MIRGKVHLNHPIKQPLFSWKAKWSAPAELSDGRKFAVVYSIPPHAIEIDDENGQCLLQIYFEPRHLRLELDVPTGSGDVIRMDGIRVWINGKPYPFELSSFSESQRRLVLPQMVFSQSDYQSYVQFECADDLLSLPC